MYRAACRTIVGSRAQEPLCGSAHEAGQCEPGSKLDLVCRDQSNQAAHRTRCVYVGDTADSTASKAACKCAAGYTNPDEKASVDDVENDAECVDVNECLSATQPCNGTAAGNNTYVGARSACQNTDGFYRCLTDLPQACSPDQNYGGCWRDHQSDTGTACIDMFPEFQRSIAYGVADEWLPPLHRCDCAAVEGCWRGDGTTCTAACPSSQCDDGECFWSASSVPLACPLLAPACLCCSTC